MKKVIQQFFSFLLVGALWGCTNPFLRSGSKDLVEGGEADGRSWFRRTLATLLNFRFIIPFALNQSGSMVYYYLLGTADITLASPICNSLTFAFTAITSWLLGEKLGSFFYTAIGIFLVVTGVTVCTLSKV